MPEAMIHVEANGAAWLYTPYDPMFVARLKAGIPGGQRKWDADIKAWWVSAAFLDTAKIIISDFWEYETKGAPKPPPNSKTKGGDSNPPHCSTLHLLQSAPPEVIRATYKTLALLHHPDRQGDSRKMQEINAAYDLIKEERGL